MSAALQARIFAVLRQVAAILMAVEGSTDVVGTLPAGVRVALVAIGGIIIAIEHAVAGVTSGAPVLVNTGATLPAPPVAPPVAQSVTVDGKTYDLKQ